MIYVTLNSVVSKIFLELCHFKIKKYAKIKEKTLQTSGKNKEDDMYDN
jgi:hypothetical protein